MLNKNYTKTLDGFSYYLLNCESTMVVPSILAFFVLSHLLFLHSAGEDNTSFQNCPQSFQCGRLGQINFPYSNTTYPQCGFCTVDCSEATPKLNFGVEQQWYEVHDKFLNHEVQNVTDKILESLIKSKSCDVFTFYLPTSLLITPSVSFIVSPNLTFFKCPSGVNGALDKQIEHFLRHNHSYSYYKGCLGNAVYYKYPDDPHQSLINDRILQSCAHIQLPVVSLNDSRKRNVSDLFSVLSSEFSLGFNVSKECSECHLKGGHCHRYNSSKFQCTEQAYLPKKSIAQAKHGTKHVILILPAVFAGIGILVILLFCIIRKLAQNDQFTFFWKTKTEKYRNVEAFLKNYGSLAPKRYTYFDIKKMTNSFRVKLGQGGYGCVFKGNLENGSLVAVKVLKELKDNGEDFINEVAAISRTSHVNIVNLLGFCFDGHNRALVYEFMPNGSLEKFIYDRNSLTYHQLGWEALYKIAIGIARGLEYLHRGCNMRILHFDIKPHNILLNEDFCPKISDFGLAKLCPQKESIVSLLGARGTAGYIAPEVFCRNFGGVSHKSDVYSYGMMILEMVGGRKNIDIKVDHTSEIYFPDWIYKRLELDGELGVHGIMNDEANESARKMIIVGLWCIQTDKSHRPSMNRVVEMLEGSLESLRIPPKPYLSSPPRSPPNSTLMP
ncbi:unnamed protein product [Camellia sinensis]